MSRVDALDTFHPSASDVFTLTVDVTSDASYAADAASTEAVRVSLVSVLLLLSRTRQKSIVSSGLNALTSTLVKRRGWEGASENVRVKIDAMGRGSGLEVDNTWVCTCSSVDCSWLAPSCVA